MSRYVGRTAADKADALDLALQVWSSDLISPSKLDPVEKGVSIAVSEIQSHGGPCGPELVTRLNGCGWVRDEIDGEWTIARDGDESLPSGLQPQLLVAMSVAAKYRSVVVPLMAGAKRPREAAGGGDPEEDRADELLGAVDDALGREGRGGRLPDGWASAKDIKTFPGIAALLDEIKAGGYASRGLANGASGALPSSVCEDLASLDTYESPQMQTHQISGITGAGLIV